MNWFTRIPTLVAVLVFAGCTTAPRTVAPNHCPNHRVPLQTQLMYRVRSEVHVQPVPEPANADRRFPFHTRWYYVATPGKAANIPEQVRFCPRCDAEFDQARR